jgi:hypothetical protein
MRPQRGHTTIAQGKRRDAPAARSAALGNDAPPPPPPFDWKAPTGREEHAGATMDGRDVIARWICLAVGAAVALLFLYALVIVVINLIADWSKPKTVIFDKVYFNENTGRRAYIPIGMLLGWLIDANLVSRYFRHDAADQIVRFKSRSLTGPEIYEKWDGVLAHDMLNMRGNHFLKWYMDKYYGDFAATLCGESEEFDERCFEVDNTWENYDRMKKVVDARFQFWKEQVEDKMSGASK